MNTAMKKNIFKKIQSRNIQTSIFAISAVQQIQRITNELKENKYFHAFEEEKKTLTVAAQLSITGKCVKKWIC